MRYQFQSNEHNSGLINNYKEHMNRLYIISMYLLSALVHYVALEGKLAIIATVGGLPD